jgi:IS30 family transposase
MQDYEGMEYDHPGLRVYFAYPFHSWERGTNENTNGLLRFYFPKKMSFAHISQKQLDAAVLEINTRPRKRLGYKTPSQVLKATGALRIRD